MTNSIFEELWWLNTVSPNRNWEESVIKDDDGIVVARWITSQNTIEQPPQTQTVGYYLNENYLIGDSYKNKRKELINSLIDKLPPTVNIYLSPENDWVLPFKWKGFSITPCFSYRITDLKNPQDIYNRFAKIVKKNIKSAKNKVDVSIGNEIDTLYVLMTETFQKQGRKFPYHKDLFERIYTAANEHNACQILYAYDKVTKEPHCGIMLVYDCNCCYYLLAGSNSKYRNSGANSLLLWEGIQFASTVSSKFDFEGSMIEGIESFIRQFGASPTLYYRVCRQSLTKDIMDVLRPRIKKILGWK